MSPRFDPAITRRRFVQFLAGSPLLTHPGVPALAQSTSTPSRLADPMVWAPRDLDNLISDPKEALDVFDFEPVAKKNLPPAHFGYMVTGIDDEVTLRANREGFLKFQLRPRRLVDVSTLAMTTEILGATYDSPIASGARVSSRAFARIARRPERRAAVQFIKKFKFIRITSRPISSTHSGCSANLAIPPSRGPDRVGRLAVCVAARRGPPRPAGA